MRKETKDKTLKRRREERHKREAFDAQLHKLLEERQLNFSSKWSLLVKEKLQYEHVYLDMLGLPGSTPQEIFQDLIKAEKDVLKKHKSSFKTLIKVRFRLFIE